jgi:hypothetical protein
MRSAWKTFIRLRQGGAASEVAPTFGRDEVEFALEAVGAVLAEPESTPTQAVECARMLMGQYRARDFVDAEVFASSLSTVFQCYRKSLCRLAVDPMVGIPSEVKFPPSVQEVREWLDRETGRLDYYRWRATQVREAHLSGPKAVTAEPQEPRVAPEKVAALLASLARPMPAGDAPAGDATPS